MIVLAIVGETAGYDRVGLLGAPRSWRTAPRSRSTTCASTARRRRRCARARICWRSCRTTCATRWASCSRPARCCSRAACPPTEERARRQVEAIQRAGNRMNRLIRDLLDFASIQAGRLSVSTRPQAVGDMVSEVLEALEPLAAAKAQRLHADVPPGMEMRVRSRPRHPAVLERRRQRHQVHARRGRNPHHRRGRPAGQPAWCASP